MGQEVLGQTFAVIIAIENFEDDKGPSIQFAQNNAKALKQMLVETYQLPEGNLSYYLNEQANLETIEEELPKIIDNLSPLDTFFFFYIGHAYSNRGENLFTLYDSNLENLNGTCAYFDELLLEPLARSQCKRAFSFIDASVSQLLETIEIKSSIADIDEKEFFDHVSKLPNQAFYFSTSAGQLSHSSSKLKLGIWIWHLLKALSGEADKALNKQNSITLGTLKKFLARSIPIYITKETNIRGTQEPIAIIGNDTDLSIAQFADDQFEEAHEVVSLNAKEYQLRRIERQLYKDFSGYIKGRNSEPRRHCSSAEAWAERLTEQEIKEEIENVYKGAKALFGLKKRECEKNPEAGFLATPPFRYTINAFQDAKDFRFIKTTRILELRMPMSSIPKGLDSVFPKIFENLYIPIEGTIDFDDLVDSFEDLESEGHGELTDLEDSLIFAPKGAKGVRDIVINEKGIVVNFSAQNESIETMLSSTQETFSIISNPMRKLLN